MKNQYTFTQIRNEIKLDTKNYTTEKGTFRFAYEDECLNAIKVLEKHYSFVDYYTDDDKFSETRIAYIIEFSK